MPRLARSITQKHFRKVYLLHAQEFHHVWLGIHRATPTSASPAQPVRDLASATLVSRLANRKVLQFQVANGAETNQKDSLPEPFTFESRRHL